VAFGLEGTCDMAKELRLLGLVNVSGSEVGQDEIELSNLAWQNLEPVTNNQLLKDRRVTKRTQAIMKLGSVIYAHDVRVTIAMQEIQVFNCRPEYCNPGVGGKVPD
jgi:hypothetical protein